MPSTTFVDGVLILREGTWADLHEPALEVRRAVFQDEQGVASHYDEDGLDVDCTHVVIESGDGRPLGTSRLKEGQLGRLAVVKDARKHGLGFLLVASMLRIAHRQGLDEVWANAQDGALGLARIFGFTIDSQVYMLAGLPHHRVYKMLNSDDRPGG